MTDGDAWTPVCNRREDGDLGLARPRHHPVARTSGRYLTSKSGPGASAPLGRAGDGGSGGVPHLQR